MLRGGWYANTNDISRTEAREAARHPTMPPKQRVFLSTTPLVPRLRKPATPERTGGYISLRCRLELFGHHLVSPSPQLYQEPPLPTVLRKGSKHRGGKPSKKRHSQQWCEEPKAGVSLQSPALAAPRPNVQSSKAKNSHRRTSENHAHPRSV